MPEERKKKSMMTSFNVVEFEDAYCSRNAILSGLCRAYSEIIVSLRRIRSIQKKELFTFQPK